MSLLSAGAAVLYTQQVGYIRKQLIQTARVAICVGAMVGSAFAAPPTALQGPADVNRVRVEDKILPQMPSVDLPAFESKPVAVPLVEDSASFVLKNLKIEGVTAFPEEEIAALYSPYINQPITLDVAYRIAGKITEHYRAAGYFLSVANVMDRDAKAGTLTIKVTEGYIGEVELSDSSGDARIVRDYIAEIKEEKPISSAKIESFLLRLNDLPGISFRAVLAKTTLADEAAVKLILIPSGEEGRGSISFDNFGSRFLGPNEVAATYSKSLVPLTQTSVSVVASAPTDELQSGSIEQTVVVAPNVTLGVTASHTKAQPGFTLEPFEIESDSTSIGFYATYQMIRQRQENLSVKLAVDGRHSTTDLLNVPFMRDDVRAIRASVHYDTADRWQGTTSSHAIVSQGINGLGSSQAGDVNLSRAEAKPDFTKAEFAVARLQGITDSWSVLLAATGQIASGPLYSSEEFGYGGQSFGRAYDASEITGDHGINASAELRYKGWDIGGQVGVQPYAFYDIGAVWNDDTAQRAKENASSAGVGVRLTTDWNMTGNVGVAFPLTREIAAPVYGSGRQGPRVMVQVTQGF